MNCYYKILFNCKLFNMHMNSKSLDHSKEDDDEEIEVQNQKKLQFINKLAGTNRKSFQATWLNTVTKDNRKELEEKLS